MGQKYIQLVCVLVSSVIGMPNGMLKKNTRITFMKIFAIRKFIQKNWLTQPFQLLKSNAVNKVNVSLHTAKPGMVIGVKVEQR